MKPGPRQKNKSWFGCRDGTMGNSITHMDSIPLYLIASYGDDDEGRNDWSTPSHIEQQQSRRTTDLKLPAWLNTQTLMAARILK